jgi:acyl carrier protein
MATSIEQKLRVAISEQLGVPEDEITADSTFVQDLGADSLDAVEIVMIAEEEFGIEVDEEQAETLATFGDLCAYIERATAPKSRAKKAASGARAAKSSRKKS